MSLAATTSRCVDDIGVPYQHHHHYHPTIHDPASKLGHSRLGLLLLFSRHHGTRHPCIPYTCTPVVQQYRSTHSRASSTQTPSHAARVGSILDVKHCVNSRIPTVAYHMYGTVNSDPACMPPRQCMGQAAQRPRKPCHRAVSRMHLGHTLFPILQHACTRTYLTVKVQ
jgi:hypothetical protein